MSPSRKVDVEVVEVILCEKILLHCVATVIPIGFRANFIRISDSHVVVVPVTYHLIIQNWKFLTKLRSVDDKVKPRNEDLEVAFWWLHPGGEQYDTSKGTEKFNVEH